MRRQTSSASTLALCVASVLQFVAQAVRVQDMDPGVLGDDQDSVAQPPFETSEDAAVKPHEHHLQELGAAESLSSLAPPLQYVVGAAWSALARFQGSASATCEESIDDHFVGCKESCSCSWHQSCYPKRRSGAEHDIGICSASISLLTLSSIILIVAVFGFIVVLRLVLQHQQYLRERAEHEAQLAKEAAVKSTAAEAKRPSRIDRKGTQLEDWEDSESDNEPEVKKSAEIIL